jgi:hypothetical protein
MKLQIAEYDEGRIACGHDANQASANSRSWTVFLPSSNVLSLTHLNRSDMPINFHRDSRWLLNKMLA